MDAVKQMRRDVKKYIDTADEKVLKMVHAMLEVDAESDWWDTMPDDVKTSVNQALEQSARGEVIPHEDVKAKYPQWFTKQYGH